MEKLLILNFKIRFVDANDDMIKAIKEEILGAAALLS